MSSYLPLAKKKIYNKLYRAREIEVKTTQKIITTNFFINNNRFCCLFFTITIVCLFFFNDQIFFLCVNLFKNQITQKTKSKQLIFVMI